MHRWTDTKQYALSLLHNGDIKKDKYCVRIRYILYVCLTDTITFSSSKWFSFIRILFDYSGRLTRLLTILETRDNHVLGYSAQNVGLELLVMVQVTIPEYVEYVAMSCSIFAVSAVCGTSS